MITFDKTDLHRIAISSVGAVALTATLILGVSAPAHAAVPAASIDAWQSAVERQLDSDNETNGGNGRVAQVAQVALTVRCGADGRCGDVALTRSSGDATIDRTALATARAVHYPALPASYVGRPTDVRVHLYYGSSAGAIAAARARADRDDGLHYADRALGRGGATRAMTK